MLSKGPDIFQAAQHLRRALLGVFLVGWALLSGPHARAQTATQVNYATEFGQFWLGNGSNVIAYSGPFSEPAGGNIAPRLDYIPAGGTGFAGSAGIQVPLTGDAKQLARFCAKEGRRAEAVVTVSGPFGMKVKRSVNLCRVFDANAVETKMRFTALDVGRYSVTIQNRDYYGQVNFIFATRALRT